MLDDFATYEELERESGEHVESEAEASDVDECIILKLYDIRVVRRELKCTTYRGEIVKDIALCLVSEDEERRYRERHARDKRYEC